MKVRLTALGTEDGPHFSILQQAGFEVLAADRTKNYWNAAELVAELEGCTAVIAGVEPYTREVLTQLPQLRVIARQGVGFDAIDLTACDERQIPVAITPGVNHEAVAEHTIAMLTGLARGFPDRDQFVRNGTWIRYDTKRIAGSTLGLLGLGRIGRAVASRGRGLGMKVIAHDPLADAVYAKEHGIELVPLSTLLAQSDFVSLHLSATPETYRLINEKTLAQMKPGAMLINTARGSLVDEAAVAASLQAGHLGGAGLDVFDIEPLPLNSPLLACPRVLLSGHVAGLDGKSRSDMLKMSAETIIALHAGQWPSPYVQNLKLAEQWKW